MKKLKAVCWIIGIAVIVGGILYFLLKLRSDHDEDSVPEDKEDVSMEDTRSSGQKNEDPGKLNKVKAEVENDIKKRHEETKKELKGSVNSIFSDDAPDQTKNSEKIQKMHEDLE